MTGMDSNPLTGGLLSFDQSYLYDHYSGIVHIIPNAGVINGTFIRLWRFFAYRITYGGLGYGL